MFIITLDNKQRLIPQTEFTLTGAGNVALNDFPIQTVWDCPDVIPSFTVSFDGQLYECSSPIDADGAFYIGNQRYMGSSYADTGEPFLISCAYNGSTITADAGTHTVSVFLNAVTEIHGYNEKLKSGKVVKGINTIDSFSFTLLMSNPGFSLVHDFTTLVKVYNTNKDRYEFFGRVLYSDTTMSDTGLITKEVTCESYFGFLCDSQQEVVGTKNWTVSGLLQHIIDKHNEQVEDYKRFTLGEVTVTDPNDNLYLGIQYANSWDTLQEKLVGKLGGELRLRVENGVNYVDYLIEIGKSSTTEIALSHNMKSIKQEKDPSAYVTRLIPLGMKMGENDERMTIEEVNNGVKYIDDADGIEKYGIHVGYVEWDDVTEAANLLKKGKAWMEENNRLLIKYSITALDLSLLGLDVDDFDVGNYHPIKNALMGVDDTARIIKKSIDVCEEVKSTIEIGDNFKSMSDIQVSQAQESKKAYSQISKTDAELRLYVADKIKGLETSFSETVKGITMDVSNGKTSSSIKLMLGETEIDSAEIKLTGMVTFSALSSAPGEGQTKINGGWIDADTLTVNAAKVTGKLTAANVEVEAAAIKGSLSIGTMPEDVAKKTDIPTVPTNISAFTNDSEYVPKSNMTTIVEGIVTTEYIYARGVSATYLKGETIDLRDADGDTLGQFDIYTDSYNNDCVRLSATEIIELIAPEEIYLEAGGYYFFLNEDGLSLNCDMEPSKRACCGTENFPWYEVYVQYDPVVTSDRRKKKNIVYGADSMDSFFDELKPSKYQLLEEDQEHDHWGFVAQDIKENLERHKIPLQSFGGFVERTDKNGETHLGLRYGEFVPLLVDQVQKLKARVARLEGKKNG